MRHKKDANGLMVVLLTNKIILFLESFEME